MQRSVLDKAKQNSVINPPYIDLDTTSDSSSSSSSNSSSSPAHMDSIEIPESDLSDSDPSSDADYDEKISNKERAIREVDEYLTKLKDRRKQLVDECNKLKDDKALRQSNKLAKQNWDSGECRSKGDRKSQQCSLMILWRFCRHLPMEFGDSIDVEKCVQIKFVPAATVEMLQRDFVQARCLVDSTHWRW